MCAPDPADLDNALNMLSALSFPITAIVTWGNPINLLKTLVSALFGTGSFILPPGGNNPAGVLGQVSGALELAEQIARGQ